MFIIQKPYYTEDIVATFGNDRLVFELKNHQGHESKAVYQLLEALTDSSQSYDHGVMVQNTKPKGWTNQVKKMESMGLEVIGYRQFIDYLHGSYRPNSTTMFTIFNGEPENIREALAAKEQKAA